MTIETGQDYPYIRKAGKIFNVESDRVFALVQRARQEQAPETVFDYDTVHHEWQTIDKITWNRIRIELGLPINPMRCSGPGCRVRCICIAIDERVLK